MFEYERIEFPNSNFVQMDQLIYKSLRSTRMDKGLVDNDFDLNTLIYLQ